MFLQVTWRSFSLERVRHPDAGYGAPLAEAKFIRDALPGAKVGNDYNLGGCLLWVLGPDAKVMIDSRQFPYLDWLQDYWDYLLGAEPEPFWERFPSDVWCADLRHELSLVRFLRSPLWKLVFYGPEAAVFVRTDGPYRDMEPLPPSGLERIMDFRKGVNLFRIALLEQKDYPLAARILAILDQFFHSDAERRQLLEMSAILAGVQAYYRHEFEQAASILAPHFASHIANVRVICAESLLHVAQAARERGDRLLAREAIETAVFVAPDNAYALFNAGVEAWRKSRELGMDGPEPEDDWRNLLDRFLDKREVELDIPRDYWVAAERLLQGGGEEPAFLEPPTTESPREP